MQKVFFRICSLLLTVVLLANMLPLSIFAEAFQEKQTTIAAENAAKVTDAQIVAEVVENRTEYTKEFKLDNGLFTAAVYSNPVHYLQDGQWTDIDNTLKASTDGAFTNTAGIWDILLPQQLAQGAPISITKDGYTLSFNMAGELRQQGNLEVASTETEIQNATLDAAAVATSEPSTEAETEPVETTPETEPISTEPPAAEPTEAETEPVPTEEPVTEPTVQETEPEETVAETQPEETVPETPTETEPTVPQETIALLPSQEVATVSINGVAQTFAVRSAQAATGRVQTVDLTEAKESAEYEEFILEKNASQLMYANVYQNTNIQYDLQGNTLKESIILNSYNSAIRGYRYTLNVGEMIPVLNDDGSIHFYDKDRAQIVMVMDAPYLVDKANAISTDVQVSLTGSGSTYTLVYLLPTAWLASSQRSWPVILDPIVNADFSRANIIDQGVSELNENSLSPNILECGYGPSNHNQRFYVKYVNLPTLTSSDVIVNATISLFKPENSGDRTSVVEVHKVLNTWELDTLSWSNQPEIDQMVEDYQIAKNRGTYTWDVTDIVRGWYSGANTGMVFKVDAAAEASTNSSWQQFYSSECAWDTNRPYLVVTFRNNNGLEDYWDYTATSAGRAGTGYVNSYTGNLVWVREDIGFGGNRMPVSISHVYNLNDSTNNDFGMGYGWRTNFNQRVYQWSQSSSYYVWEDADGTDHYFEYYSSSTYKDEANPELTLKTNGSGTKKYSIIDKNGNISYFDTNGRLTFQQNNQATKSSITVTYTTASGLLIDTITDGAGRVYDFTYSSNLLSSIQYLGSGNEALATLTFAYTGGNLTSVTDPDDETSSYTYTAGHILSVVHAIRVSTVNYTYHQRSGDHQPYRVKNISLHHNSVDGNTLELEYAHNQTTFTDHNGNVEIMQFNDFGNTVSIQDNEGHAQHRNYAINKASESGSANQLRLDSKLQNTVGNRLQDGGFEAGSAWSALGTHVSVTCSEDAEYMGKNGLRIYSSQTDATGIGATRGTVYIPAGSTYTFSAYVKTGDIPAQLAITDGTNISKSTTLDPGSNWTRLETSYTNNTNQSVGLTLQLLTQGKGTIYMDNTQMELAPTASRYNIITNGDFRNNSTTPLGWERGSGLTSEDVCVNKTSAAAQLDQKTFHIVGSATAQKRLTQKIEMGGEKGDNYVLAGWAKGDSAPLRDDREFGIIGTFHYTDETTKSFTAHFNPDADSSVNWQYSAEVMVAEKDYTSITVELAYDYNVNEVWFDGIQLYKEQFGNSYTYDENGNVKSVVDLQNKTTNYEYDNNDLTKIIENGKAKMTYTYDNYHNVTKAVSEEGLTYSFTYDTYGNNTSVSIEHDGVKITSSATYANNGNTLATTKDALGKTTTYEYDADTNVLNWVKYPRDNEATKTTYTYDEMYRVATAAATTNKTSALSAEYTYIKDLLTEIETPTTSYTFGYGSFGLRTRVSAGNYTLATYTYTNDKNKDLKKLAYNNGNSVEYTYDTKGRVLTQTYEDGVSLTYQYDNDGGLGSVYDSATQTKTIYLYDTIGRLRQTQETGDGVERITNYTYDTNNNLVKSEKSDNGSWIRMRYTYDEDNRISGVTYARATTSYVYDNFGRLESYTTNHTDHGNIVTEAFTYTNNSTQVKKMTSTAENREVTYEYEYDNNGNIASVTSGGKVTSYYYDTANQLIRENNEAANFTRTWIYDDAGNIVTHKEYDYTTENSGNLRKQVNYTYADTNGWGDLLTGLTTYIYVNGEIESSSQQTFEYDGIGNPTSDGTWNYTWEHGRQLASMSKEDGSEIWNYTYNAEGLRTSRSNNNGTTYTYQYNGDQLQRLKVVDEGTTANMYFIYNADGPMLMSYNGTIYYYTKNLQGDITGLVDAQGNSVVEYTYDAWGNVLSIEGSKKDSVGKYNPLRYRSYVYDQETEIYYLQSRYYSPKTGRFINADDPAYLGVNGLLSHNLFAYCLDNPVNGCDPCGTCFHRWDFWNDCANCGGQTIKDKVIDYYENGLTLNGSVGLYGSANLGVFNVTGSVALAVDLKGNIQIIGSGSFDVTTAGSLSATGGANASLYAMPDTSYYAGDTYYAGGSVAVPNPACPAVAVGVGGNVGRTSDGYWGIDGGLGIGTASAVGAEFHGGYSRTASFTEQFNVFEWIISLF